MATIKNVEGSKLVLKVQTGTDESGNAVYANRSFAAMNPVITDDNMRIVGNGLSQLQKYPLASVIRQDTAVLEEGE